MDVSKREADGAVVTLSDGTVALRPWARQDAWFMAEASADPAIRRYNGTLDRFGFPAPPLSATDAETVISEFTSSWEAFAAAGTPGAGVAFAIVDASSGELVGCLASMIGQSPTSLSSDTGSVRVGEVVASLLERRPCSPGGCST